MCPALLGTKVHKLIIVWPLAPTSSHISRPKDSNIRQHMAQMQLRGALRASCSCRHMAAAPARALPLRSPLRSQFLGAPMATLRGAFHGENCETVMWHAQQLKGWSAESAEASYPGVPARCQQTHVSQSLLRLILLPQGRL
jgi:hypothetical protein